MIATVRRLGLALFVPCVAAGVSLSAQSAAPAAQKPAETAAALPSAESILEKHVATIGGRDALKGRTSVKMTGTITIPANGMTGTLETYAARPNKQLVKSSIAGIGEILEGFDGKNAWSLNPMMGPMLLDGEQLAERAQDADFDSIMNVSARYASMKTLEKTTFDGRECYKVSLTRKSGGEDIEFYDVATGLKAGSTTTRKSPMGAITATTTLKDYKKVGDLLQPMEMRQSANGVEIVTTFKTIEFDKVDPAVFDPPAQIKALIK